MPEKKRVSPWLRGTLYVVAILVLPAFIIQTIRTDAIDPKQPRPTLQIFRFSSIVRTGAFYGRLHWRDSAIAKFQEAELFAEQMSDRRYESLQEARSQLAESYLSAGQTAEAEQTYARIVKSSMDAGDSLRLKNQFEKAVPMYRDAEKFAQKLTVAKGESLLSAQRSLAGCLLALKRNAELEPVYTRIIATLQDQADPYNLELGNYYQALAMVRSDLVDFAGAEEALLQAAEAYDSVAAHFSASYDSSGRDLQAKSQKDFITASLAICYFNEKKMNLALSAAEDAFQNLSRRAGPRGVPIGVYTVGLQAATAVNNHDQVQLWQKRLDELTSNHPRAAEESAIPGVAHVP